MGITAIAAIRANSAITCITAIIAIKAIIDILVITTIVCYIEEATIKVITAFNPISHGGGPLLLLWYMV